MVSWEDVKKGDVVLIKKHGIWHDDLWEVMIVRFSPSKKYVKVRYLVDQRWRTTWIDTNDYDVVEVL